MNLKIAPHFCHFRCDISCEPDYDVTNKVYQYEGEYRILSKEILCRIKYTPVYGQCPV